jgi:hypothetical protein
MLPDNKNEYRLVVAAYIVLRQFLIRGSGFSRKSLRNSFKVSDADDLLNPSYENYWCSSPVNIGLVTESSTHRPSIENIS